MQKKQIITIAGKPGGGKSTTSKAVANALDYTHFSSGDLFRAIGKERGIDVFQTNLMAENEREIDLLVDQKLRDLGENENEMVIDSRMAWHWMPYSFKVYLDLDLTIAAQRILSAFDDARTQAEEIPSEPAEYAKRLKERLDSEVKRYASLYQANPYNLSNYDLVIDTEKHNLAEVQEIILTKYQDWLQ